MFMTLWITQTIGLLLLMAGMIVIMVAACSKPYRWSMRNLFFYFNLSAGLYDSFYISSIALSILTLPVKNWSSQLTHWELTLKLAEISF